MERQAIDTLDLVLPVEWPFPPLVDILPEDRPRVAMHIARAFREEARQWEQQAFQLAAGDTPRRLAAVAWPSVPKEDHPQKRQVWGTDQ